MGWVAGPSLVAATANAGCLGILASATMTIDELRQAIADIQQRTDKPFGVNMRADSADLGDRIQVLIATNNDDDNNTDDDNNNANTDNNQIRVASFAGAPAADDIKQLQDAGIAVMPTVGAVRHAEKVAELGVDVIMCQGSEGGGHTGVVPTSLLLPQVLNAVDVPVIAAGGFTDGRGLAAALAWGASGIAMGTRFLLTQESKVPANIKTAYLNSSVTNTVVTDRIDGSPQRVIKTKLVDTLESRNPLRWLLTLVPLTLVNALRFRKLIGMPTRQLLREARSMKRNMSLQQTLMAPNAAMLTRASLVEGNHSGVLPTGQCVGLIDDLPTCEELVQRIVTDAQVALTR